MIAEVIYEIVKHFAGRHDQMRHAPSHGVGEFSVSVYDEDLSSNRDAKVYSSPSAPSPDDQMMQEGHAIISYNPKFGYRWSSDKSLEHDSMTEVNKVDNVDNWTKMVLYKTGSPVGKQVKVIGFNLGRVSDYIDKEDRGTLYNHVYHIADDFVRAGWPKSTKILIFEPESDPHLGGKHYWDTLG